ncbi:hypothetical protein [Algoriphagus sp.]|uniref:hypothetical protein n=1 Tax=Algoriphagus sp. TaxID=1872435 RepID=UPI003274DB0E
MTKYLSVLSILSITVILLGVNRGFDFSDEGLYLLLADPQQQNIGGVYNYDLFFKLIYHFTGVEVGIVGSRLIRLLSYLAGALALSVFWKNLNQQLKITLPVFLLSLSGLIAGYSFLPPSLSYNSISVVAVCFWLAIISKKSLQPKDWLYLGLVLMVLFYAKITVCLALGGFTLLFFLLKKSLSLARIALLLLPMLLFEVIFYGLFLENALMRLSGEFGFLQQRKDYTFLLLLKYTAVGGFWSFLAGFLFFAASKAKKYGFQFYPLLLILALSSLLLVFYFTLITSEWSHLVLLLTFAGIAWVLGDLQNNDLKKDELLLLIALVLLPFILHFGSNVYWMRLGIHYWVFWLLALVFLFQKKGYPKPMQLYVFASSISLVLVVFGIWLTPFEGAYLWQATERWEYRTGKSIYISPAQTDFLRLIDEEIKKSKPRQLVAFYSNPGILYLLGKNQPYSPGYWKPSQARLFFHSGSDLAMILFNELEEFPFERADWTTQKEVIQPNGEKLLIIWKK